MPSMVPDRETFTLLNLSESESGSPVPDLDLAPPRKLNKRKIKLKRSERGGVGGGLRGGGGGGGGAKSAGGDYAATRYPPGGGGLCACPRVGLAIAAMTVTVAFSYSIYLLNAKIQSLSLRLINVDDSAKSLPSSLQQLQISVEKLQESQGEMRTSLSQLEARVTRLEAAERPQPGGRTVDQGAAVQQSLAGLSSRLAEVRLGVESATNKSEENAKNIKKLFTELNINKMNEIDLKNGREGEREGGERFPGPGPAPPTSPLIAGLNASLAEVGGRLARQEARLAQLEEDLTSVGQNSTARLDWLNKDVTSLQVKFGEMEDDNRNISTQAATAVLGLTQQGQEVANLAGKLSQLATRLDAVEEAGARQLANSSPAAASQQLGYQTAAVRQQLSDNGQSGGKGPKGQSSPAAGPRDKRGTILEANHDHHHHHHPSFSLTASRDHREDFRGQQLP